MAFDINNKISQIKKDLERLEAELDSFNRANYDGSENSNVRKKQKQIKEKQLELLKYRNVKAMQQKDTMEILKLSGFTVDGDIILPQHEAKDDDATEEGAIKEYGKEKGSFEDGWKHYRDSKGNIWELVNPQGSFWMMECIRGPRKGDTATFKKEMVESSMTEDACNKDGGPGSGIKGHTTSRSGYKMEDPKEIEAAIKKVKASGHANPYYLSGLERALQVAKEERGIKDDCGEKVFTKGTKDDFWNGEQDTMTSSEARSYWNKYHNSDPVLKLYKTFEQWYSVSKRNGYIKDDKFKLFEIRGVGLPEKYIGNIEADSSLQAQQKFIQNNPSYKNKNIKAVKDSDPKVAEAEAIINLCGGVR